MEKTRKQLVATVAAMLGDQYKVSISIRHFEESLKEFDSTYFIEIVKKAAEDSLVPVIALDPFYNRTAIGMVQPGEYYMITAGTAQYKNGLSFAELQSIFANLGCTYARSMDGGGSSSLVVNGKLLNTPAQYDERPVVDFLSFLP